jgi:hypothetical protein
MHTWQIIIGLIVVSLLGFSIWFIYREVKSKRKIPYQNLFKRKEYLVRNNKFIGWMVVIFFLSIFSIGFLFKITLISLPLFIAILLIITFANIYFFRKKYKIKEATDVAFLSIVIGMGQVSLFMWLNFIPIGSHSEAYQILRYEVDDNAHLTTIYLKDNALSTYYTVRAFETGNAPIGDTVIYHFNEGLVGFRVYTGHSSH